MVNIELTADDWEVYENKFGDLIAFIAHRITGDPMCCDFESNLQDLRMAALNSISGYYKKNNITQKDKSIVEVMECPLFKAYTKTVLWNAKNHKGNKATKYKNFMPTSLDSLENKNDLVQDDSITESLDNTDFLNFIGKKFNEEERSLVNYIVNNPKTIRENGTINYNRTAIETNSSFYKVKKVITNLMEKFNNE